RVQEEDRHAPHGHELEPAPGQGVVAGAGPLTLRASRLPVGPGPELDLELQSSAALHEPDGAVHEARLLLDAMQDSLQLHPVVGTSCGDDWLAPPSSQERERDVLATGPGTRRGPPGTRPSSARASALARAQRAKALRAVHACIGRSPSPGDGHQVGVASGELTYSRESHPQICRKTHSMGRPRGRQTEFLRAHATAKGRALNMRSIAEAAGYKDFRGANLQYGL